MMAAVMVGAALCGSVPAAEAAQASQTAAPSSTDGPPTEVVRNISRYCQACWRNARLHPDSWSDATQEVLTRLLQTVAHDRWVILLKSEGDERREFLRAIDAVRKRTQRGKRYSGLIDEVSDRRDSPEQNRSELREELRLAASEVLSDRQSAIISLTSEGWSIPEIAERMQTTAERISDEKYKAIRKLRSHLHVVRSVS